MLQKRKPITTLIILALLGAMAMFTMACGDDKPNVRIDLSPGVHTMKTAETLRLAANVRGNSAVLWSALDGLVVNDANDKEAFFTPTSAGTYEIVVTAAADKKQTARAIVTVTEAAITIAITAEPARVEVGEPVTLIANTTGVTDVRWPEIDGLVASGKTATFTPPATSGGQDVTITVTATAEAGVTATATVEVAKPFDGVVFTAKRTTVTGGYTWTVLLDGEPTDINVKSSAYTYEPIYLVASTGVYQRTAEYDEETISVTEKVLAYPGLIDGYHFNAPVKNKIELGVKETEYAFAPDAKVYRLDAHLAPEKFVLAIADIPSSWNGRYWARLNANGTISHLFLSYTDASTPCTPSQFVSCPNSTAPSAADLETFAVIQKFDSGEGPVVADPGDEDNELTTEYLYFAPEGVSASPNGKFPLLVWLHGSGGGASLWSVLMNGVATDNGSVAFAGNDYQTKFTAGGAYVMLPRANEDFAAGHGMRWNSRQVGSLFAAVDDFIEKNEDKIDPDRVYIGGFSIGAGMTWLTIRERPEFFAAALPVAPPGRFMPAPASEELKKFASMPIWIVHSADDYVVNIDADYTVTPPAAGSRPVMTELMSLAAARVPATDSRYSLLHPAYALGGHIEATAVYNNMMGSYYGLPASLYGIDPTGTMRSSDYNWYTTFPPAPTVFVESTVTDWLNAQTASANAARQ